jgi:hypothetical protein
MTRMNAERDSVGETPAGATGKPENLERDCGQSPSRSRCERKIAPEQFNAWRCLKLLRLVLRTQPRSKLSGRSPKIWAATGYESS